MVATLARELRAALADQVPKEPTEAMISRVYYSTPDEMERIAALESQVQDLQSQLAAQAPVIEALEQANAMLNSIAQSAVGKPWRERIEQCKRDWITPAICARPVVEPSK